METRPTMTDEEMIKDYKRLKYEYVQLHEDYKRLNRELSNGAKQSDSNRNLQNDTNRFTKKEPKFINDGIVMVCDNCKKEYVEYYDPSKRYMLLCDDCQILKNNW